MNGRTAISSTLSHAAGIGTMRLTGIISKSTAVIVVNLSPRQAVGFALFLAAIIDKIFSSDGEKDIMLVS